MMYQKESSKDVLGIIFYMGENVLHINDKCVALPKGYFFIDGVSCFLYNFLILNKT